MSEIASQPCIAHKMDTTYHAPIIDLDPEFSVMTNQVISLLWRALVAGVMFCVTASGQQIPPGTTVPIQVKTGLNAASDAAGKRIVGRVMQEVSLPDGGKIKEGASITGRIIRVTKPGTSGSSMVVSFDAIESGDHEIPVRAALIAVASFVEISHAQSPTNSTANMDPTSQWTTRQVGGDIVRRGWGKAGSSSGIIGKWIKGTAVVIKLTPNPKAGCPGGGPGYETEQAVWVFSSAACGTYGLSNVAIAHSGATSPAGQIELNSKKNMAIASGSGWLLMVLDGDEAAPL
jgi:hypothetical protein